MNKVPPALCLVLLPVAAAALFGAVTHKKPSPTRTRPGVTRQVKRKQLYQPSAISPQARAFALSSVEANLRPDPGHFENAEALQPFFAQLHQARQERTPVHVLQYGDSHTASDDWVDSMRKVFQDSYGFGGAGFILAGRPFKGYRRFDVSGASSSGWVTAGTVGHRGDDSNGVGGVSVTAIRYGATVSLTTTSDQVEICFLRQPGGGSFSVQLDGVIVETITTDGPYGNGSYVVPHGPGEHVYLLQTTSNAAVRLFGWIAENASGLSWATLGINGAQAQMMLNWNEGLWRDQIQQRNPALIILAFGTNEAVYPLFTPEQYRLDLLALIERFKQAVPEASLLLVGPPYCGRGRPFPYLQQVVDIQRAVARETNCAFWDWESHMDNSGGRALWLKAGLSQPDLTHLTSDGYRLLGKTIADELLAQGRLSAAELPAGQAILK